MHFSDLNIRFFLTNQYFFPLLCWYPNQLQHLISSFFRSNISSTSLVKKVVPSLNKSLAQPLSPPKALSLVVFEGKFMAFLFMISFFCFQCKLGSNRCAQILFWKKKLWNVYVQKMICSIWILLFICLFCFVCFLRYVLGKNIKL